MARYWAMNRTHHQSRQQAYAQHNYFNWNICLGGVNGNEFLSSMEQFDKSGSSWNVPLQRDWRILNTALSAPRYKKIFVFYSLF